MANVDTGLGWSADGEWLTSAAGVIVGGFRSITGDPVHIPKTPEDADSIVATGLLIATRTGSGVTTEYYLGASEDGAAYVAHVTPNNNRLVLASTVRCSVYYVMHNTSTLQNIKGSVILSSVATNGLHYNIATPSNIGTATMLYPQLATTVTTTSTIVNQVTTAISTIYKLNAGAAVVGWVNWKDTVATYWTPVLISTIEQATKLSLDNEQEYYGQATMIQRYNGMIFFMSYIRGLDGVPTSSFEMVDVSSVLQSAAQIFKGIAGPSYANILVNETVDPYDPFGNTEEGGGEPDPNPQDDDIEEEELPTLSFSSAGFARIYRPSLQQINNLADYMWTDQTFLQTVINHLKQLLENPMDAVISLSLIPCVPPVGVDVPVKVMYVNTGVSMPPVTNQFVNVDCGSFTLKEMYGSALDYNPYTKVQLYLPYIGTVKLDTDEVMGKTLQVKYNIDVVTGVCCAYVIAGGDVLYQFSGHCSINQPISSADFSSYINAAIASAKVGIAAATGGAAAAAGAAASGASAPAPAVGGGSAAPELPPSTALIPAAPSGPYHVSPNYPGGSGIRIPNINFAELAKPGNINTVASAMGGKVDVMHSGGFGGNSGYLAAVRRPYLIVTRPRIANPQQYGQFNGRPSMMYLNLGSCTGYTQVQSVYLTGFDATNPELAEISELLKGGVVL